VVTITLVISRIATGELIDQFAYSVAVEHDAAKNVKVEVSPE
jgi:hypothetical protein